MNKSKLVSWLGNASSSVRRVQALIQREFWLLVRLKWLWIVTPVVVLVGNSFITPFGNEVTVTGGWIAVAASETAVAFASYFAVPVAFRSIIHSRQSGNIRITAGTPLTRSEIIIGTAFGRGLALFCPVLMGVVGTAILGWNHYGTLPVFLLIGYTVVTALFILAVVATITAISAVVESTVHAVACSTVCVIVMAYWTDIVAAIHQFITSQNVSIGQPPQSVILLVARRLTPINSFFVVVNTLTGVGNTDSNFVDSIQYGLQGEAGYHVGALFGSGYPIVLSPWVSVLILIAWIIVPIAFASAVFSRLDLPVQSDKFRNIFSESVPRIFRRTSYRLGFIPFRVVEFVMGAVNSDPTSESWLPIARREFTDILRSLAAPLLFGLVVMAYLYSLTTISPNISSQIGQQLPAAVGQQAVTIFGLVGPVFLGYRSIAEERESGTIRYTAGLPPSRTSVLIGKGAGLWFALSVIIGYALIVCFAIGSIQTGSFPSVAFSGTLVATIMYIGTNTAIVVALSSFFSRGVAAVSAAIVYLFFVLFWSGIHPIIWDSIFGYSYIIQPPPPDSLYFLTRRLSPRQAVTVLWNWAIGVGNSGSSYTMVLHIENAVTSPNLNALTHSLVVDVSYSDGQVPIILSPVASVGTLAVWGIIPFALALRRFQTSDLT
ncbi:hypothetical protein C499_12940 [Halogeometricum borinquense DSM 11551]|uniref:Uncharacterized protein n=1 Tax=Halogeometricum borinquense (strain ATCC 700274 / DSM 11551 / JCM 10706 / KCTC 4070 / PR3) TaxID=469382 RepID=E4NUD2_HALBP|nr:ABC transporter permease subunit [Halogeometricum borinquense]ADQ68652.1 hypothetical protein Hbor_31170 [Halogeometricum borinquense DSM 11551]ELY25393.1 hypothetical protein C499_12940 [Halogeometricum borinquense DSM 11551]